VPARVRLDRELVRRGLAPSPEAAAEAVAAGRVLVSGAPATKPSRMVARAEPILLVSPGRRWASRGGDKLDPVLDRLGIEVAGRRCLDAGASTGGFTHVLLERGAARVVAADVGHGLLDARLRGDPRVEVHDGCNVRFLDPDAIGGQVDLTLADLSFISLRWVLPALAGATKPDGELLLLVKPQFEAGREAVAKGGVVRDPREWAAAVRSVAAAAAELGLGAAGVCPSPLPGPSGNVELFLHLRAGAGALDEAALDAAVAEGAALPRRGGPSRGAAETPPSAPAAEPAAQAPPSAAAVEPASGARPASEAPR
jgi:23S rRNA (cytidine1920-2'-O)/16S rRNA (cytidine1409-2'-O)-methyltransferase